MRWHGGIFFTSGCGQPGPKVAGGAREQLPKTKQRAVRVDGAAELAPAPRPGRVRLNSKKKREGKILDAPGQGAIGNRRVEPTQ